MPNTYIALTIGPVIKTILKARYTRELWGASYLYSYLMKKIIKELRDTNNMREQFIIPYVGDDKYFHSGREQEDEKLRKGAGLFPDRLFLRKVNEDDFKTVKNTVEGVIGNFANDVANHLNKLAKYSNLDIDDVHKFLQQHFHYYLIEKETNGNPIFGLTPYLNSAELQQSYVLEDQSFIADFLNSVSRSFLTKDAFDDHWSFETILEVAAREFQDQTEYKEIKKRRQQKLEGTWTKEMQKRLDEEEGEEQQELIKKLSKRFSRGEDREAVENEKRQFKAAHKYIAIVHCDGDNISRIIENLDGKRFQEFSKELSEFALDAVKKVDEYGGMTIYAGGDDLLFFAPVINDDWSDPDPEERPKRRNIFKLCHELNDTFVKKFKDQAAVSLSFGVSISYYKFPLYEALKTSRELLFDIAKQQPKNHLAYRVLKHSGQYFGGVMQMEGYFYEHFRKVLAANIEEADRVLSSITYKVQENEVLFHTIGKDPIRVRNFIKNSFNEPVHKEDKRERYLKDARQLISSAFSEKLLTEDALKEVYGALRTAAFLTGDNI